MHAPDQKSQISSHLTRISRELARDRPDFTLVQSQITTAFEILRTCSDLPPDNILDTQVELLLQLLCVFKNTLHIEAAKLTLHHFLRLLSNGRLPRVQNPSHLTYRTELFAALKTVALQLELFDIAEQIVAAQHQSLSSDDWMALLASRGPSDLRRTKETVRLLNFNARLSLDAARKDHALHLESIQDLLNLI